MRIKKGFSLHKIGNECIVIQDETLDIDFDCILNLNPTAVWLWEELENKEFDALRIAQMLTERYDVTEKRALLDAEEFVRRLQAADVIED